MSPVESDRAARRRRTSVGNQTGNGPSPDGDGVHSGKPAKARVDWGPYGRRPVFLLAAVAFIDSVDKGILPGVLSLVKDDFGLSDFQLGMLGTAFVAASLLVTLPAGYLADTARRTRVISGTLLSWGAISALNAAVQNFGQFLAVRAALGVGETIDNPSSQSLISDYYPPKVRGRAFGLQRIAPTVGTSIGLGLGGVIGSILGWRWAFLLVGAPGSILAVAIWRLQEPRRGESDGEAAAPSAQAKADGRREAKAARHRPVKTSERVPGSNGKGRATGEMVGNVRVVLRARTLRSLMIGMGFGQGATAGIAFWAASYHERHSGMSSGAAAAATSGLLLFGALLGTWLGGIAADRARARSASGPMLVSGVSHLVGAVVMLVTFLPVPVWPVRMPLQVVAVMLIVGAFPGLMVMIAEVVTATLRGAAFSIATLLGALLAAASPPAMGLVADTFPITRDGESVGNLATAFMFFLPLIAIGALVVLRGRRYAGDDIAAARRTLALEAGAASASS